MSPPAGDALSAAREWLRASGLCPHDVPIAEPCCPICAEALAAVIDRVARARVEAVRVPTPAVAAPTTECDRLRAECSGLIERLHSGLDVLADDEDDAAVVQRLRAFRVALLKFAWREAGDPEAEETLSRESFPT